jgi:NAD(P)-dependent dehydrogenase (short-subunit alcohol dehydrogenase family)
MNDNTDLSGKTIVITGATSGIGLAAARELASKGAYIIGIGRSAEKCKIIEDQIKGMYPGARIAFHTADLSLMGQVRQLAGEIIERVENEGLGCIDVLINNAGAVSSWYVSTAEGFELQFALNHLAPFLLTQLLMPLLKAAPEARILTTSSGSHYRTKINWDDIMHRKHYNCLMAYKQAKLCNVLFTNEFNRRMAEIRNVKAFAVDPGLVNTEIGLKGTSGIVRWVWQKRSRGGISPEEGAATSIYLASQPSLPDTGYAYWKQCRQLEPSTYSQREDVASRLWDVSAKMCGI